MRSHKDRSMPGVRLSVVPNENALPQDTVDLSGRILSLTFEDHERKTDKLSIELDNTDLFLFDNESLFGGVILEVSWGYPGNMANPRRVLLKKIKGFQTLTVEGHATTMLLNLQSKNRCFENASKSDVVRQIALENGYSGASLLIENTDEKYDAINQTGESDAQFLKRLAREEEFEYWIDDTGFHWHERRLDLSPSHTFDWLTGSERGDILSISVESDLMRRSGKVGIKGRDPKNKTTIEEVADNDSVDRATLGETREVVSPDDVFGQNADKLVTADVENAMLGQSIPDQTMGYEDFKNQQSVLDTRNAVEVFYSVPVSTPEQAKKKANAKFKKAERATVKLSMQVVGDPSLRAKSIVVINGISPVLSGKYYVKSVKHSVSSSGYTCDLSLICDAKGVYANRLAAAQAGRRNRHEMNRGVRQLYFKDPNTGEERIEYYVDNQYYGYDDALAEESVMESGPYSVADMTVDEGSVEWVEKYDVDTGELHYEIKTK